MLLELNCEVAVDTELANINENGLSTIEDRRPSAATCDIRHEMMNLPSEQMALMQTEYMNRRRQFRDWLRSVLIEGIHFGHPPGCEPKINDRGEVGIWMKGGIKYFPKEQWQAKPSLYKAGAQFICDLLNLVPACEPDMGAWQQLGNTPGVFAIKCQLFPRGKARVPENVTGEGFGVRKVGDKGGNENNAIKMAEKCAIVDAVLNSFGLSDLFTQDIEDGDPQPGNDKEQGVNPEPRQQPKTQPRDRRNVDEDVLANFKRLGAEWKRLSDSLRRPSTTADFSRMVCEVDDKIDPTHVLKPQLWTDATFEAVEAAVSKLQSEVDDYASAQS